VKAVYVVALLAPLGVSSGGQQPQFRASTSLVRLEVSVANDSGAVQGLQTADFIVEDRGARQTVRVEESTDVPLDLVLVAEPLPSVAYLAADQRTRVTAGLSAFLAQVQERDRLAVVAARAPPSRLRPLEFGRPSFGVAAFAAGGDYAAPLDAIAAALLEFVPSDRRRALVAFTNAADFRSTTSYVWLAEMARRLGPAFVLVGTPVKVDEKVRAQAVLGSPGGPPIGDLGIASVSGYVFPAKLQFLARRTGGITVNLGGGDPQQLMAKMFAWLRTQYVISYQPPAGKGWHPVSVKVTRRGAVVTVREGYFID
jgi:VWFA-related protein